MSWDRDNFCGRSDEITQLPEILETQQRTTDPLDGTQNAKDGSQGSKEIPKGLRFERKTLLSA